MQHLFSNIDKNTVFKQNINNDLQYSLNHKLNISLVSLVDNIRNYVEHLNNLSPLLTFT